MRTFRLQPSEYTDNLTDDGQELTRLPYPIYVSEDGWIQRPTGEEDRVIGFTTDPNVYDIPVDWKDAVRDIGSVVGLYIVVADSASGRWSTLVSAIKTAGVVE